MIKDNPDESHKGHRRSFWSFWGHGFKKAFKGSWEKYSHALIAFGLLYIIADFCFTKWANSKIGGLDMSLWLQLIIPSTLLLLFLIYHLLVAPYEIYKELHAKMEREIDKRESSIKTMTDEIQTIKDSKPDLELLPAPTDKDIDGKDFCRIVVKNNSATGTARLVKAELININPAPDLKRYSFWIGDVPYPFWLRPSDPDGAIIHPGCASKFDVFVIRRSIHEGENSGASIRLDVNLMGRPQLLSENYKGRFTICAFNPELIDEKKSSLEFKEYLIKIRISAENVPPIDKTFRVLFSLEKARDSVQIY